MGPRRRALTLAVAVAALVQSAAQGDGGRSLFQPALPAARGPCLIQFDCTEDRRSFAHVSYCYMVTWRSVGVRAAALRERGVALQGG